MGDFGPPSSSDTLFGFDFVNGVAAPFGTTTPFDLGRAAVTGTGRLLGVIRRAG